jgi:FMN-dependent NADH-azoreductase
MMKILHVTSSPRGQASESYRLSQKIISCLLKRELTAIVVNRVIGGGAISHIDASYATALGATQQSSAESSPQGLDRTSTLTAPRSVHGPISDIRQGIPSCRESPLRSVKLPCNS